MICCSCVFAPHNGTEWNHEQLDKAKRGVPAHDVWCLPETELFETVHVLRRKVVLWLRTAARAAEVEAVMSAVVRVSESNGQLLPKPGETPARWAHLVGSMGRFQQLLGGAPTAAAGEREMEVVEGSDGSMQVDVQVMQMTQSGAQPQALPSHIASTADVSAIFGSVQMQACQTERTSKRTIYQLVGRAHAIAWWEPDARLPPLDHHRAYYPEELFPSEKAWLPAVFEPVRQAYMVFPQPLEIFLPEEPLPADATVAYMIGKKPKVPGVWREIFAYRDRRMVQVYRIESHGRRFYRCLEYCSDARFCLRGMQPSTQKRGQLWPPWERHGAGHPYADAEPAHSAVITRDWTVEANLSLGTETYIPARLLYGLVPTALLERFEFWQARRPTSRAGRRPPFHNWQPGMRRTRRIICAATRALTRWSSRPMAGPTKPATISRSATWFASACPGQALAGAASNAIKSLWAG